MVSPDGWIGVARAHHGPYRQHGVATRTCPRA